MTYVAELTEAINYAAELLRNGCSFYDSVTKASQYYRVDWHDVQIGLSDRSGNARHKRAQQKDLELKW